MSLCRFLWLSIYSKYVNLRVINIDLVANKRPVALGFFCYMWQFSSYRLIYGTTNPRAISIENLLWCVLFSYVPENRKWTILTTFARCSSIVITGEGGGARSIPLISKSFSIGQNAENLLINVHYFHYLSDTFKYIGWNAKYISPKQNLRWYPF